MRVYGDGSQGWAEAAALWGASVDVIVHHRRPNHATAGALGLPCSVSLEEAVALLPDSEGWAGALFGDTSSPEEERDARALLALWRPTIALLSHRLGRKARKLRTWEDSQLFPEYWVREKLVNHREVGGVTCGWRTFTHFRRRGGTPGPDASMTAHRYARPLQAALDDTEGPAARGTVLERTLGPGGSHPQAAVGYLELKGGVASSPCLMVLGRGRMWGS